MQNFHFDELVLHDFDFLCEHGFVVTENNPTRIGFGSDSCTIYVYFGRHSREIGVEVYRKGAKDGGAGFSTLVAAFNEGIADRLPAQVPVETESAVRERISSLSADFRRYIKLDCLSSAEFWDKVVAVGQKRFANRWSTITVDQLRERFLPMWDHKDYENLVRYFALFEDSLSVEEKSMLEFAKNELKRRA